MGRLLSYAESMRGVCCKYAASLLAEYAKSMRDSSGEKYPISQGACSVVSSLTLAECSGGLALGLKRCVEGAWRVGQKLPDLGNFVEGAWKLGRKLQDLGSFVEASWKLGRKNTRFGKLRGRLGRKLPDLESFKLGLSEILRKVEIRAFALSAASGSGELGFGLR